MIPRVTYRIAVKGSLWDELEFNRMQLVFPEFAEWADDYSLLCEQPSPYSYRTVVAHVRGKAVGVWSSELSRQHLTSHFTFVAKAYRGHGIGSKMWAHGVRRFPLIESITVMTQSDTGKSLVKSLRNKYSEIDWLVA